MTYNIHEATYPQLPINSMKDLIPYKEIISVRSPGMTIWDFTKVPYQMVTRPRFPMDDIGDPFNP